MIGEVAMTQMSLRRFEQARKTLDAGIEDFPQFRFLRTLQFTARLESNRPVEEARAALDAVPASDEETFVAARYALALCERNPSDALDLLRNSSVETFVTAPTRSLWGAVQYPKPLLIGWAERLAGRPERARDAFEQARVRLESMLRDTPDDDRIHSALGLVYAGLGKRSAAIREAEQGVALCPPERDAIDSTTRLTELAQVYAECGESDRAIKTLERVLQMPAMFDVPLLRIDPAWDPLRSNRRFEQLISE